MAWEIFLFTTEREEKPVEEFIKSLEPSTIAKITHTLDLLEKYGPHLGMPHSKKLVGDIYELRIKGKQEIRILYTFIERSICLLHAFKKQRQRTPIKEISIAIERNRRLTSV